MFQNRFSEQPRPVFCSVADCKKPATILQDDSPFCGKHAPDPPNVIAARRTTCERVPN